MWTKLAGVASAIILGAWASSAQALIIDFEGYSVGSTPTSQSLTPYPLLNIGTMTIGYDPTPGIGNYAQLTAVHYGPFWGNGLGYYSGGRPSPFPDNKLIYYAPDLISFDVWAENDAVLTGTNGHVGATRAGQWFTWFPNEKQGGNFVLSIDMLSPGAIRIDNIVLQGDFKTAIPEPETWAVLIFGFALVGLAKRRQRLAA